MICTICQYTLTQPNLTLVDPESPLSHWRLCHKSVKSLSDSSSSCPLCALIWNQLSPAQQLNWLAADDDVARHEPDVPVPDLFEFLTLSAGLNGHVSRPGLRRGVLYALFHAEYLDGIFVAFRNAALPTALQLQNMAFLTGQWFQDSHLVNQANFAGGPTLNTPPAADSGPGKVGFTPGHSYHLESLKARIPKTLLGTSTSSDASIQRIRRWLTKCQHEHLECVPKSQSRTIPTRLIDVGSSNVSLRLCKGGELGDIHFLTLSHCWGHPSRAPFRLVRQNKVALFASLPITSLSQTFVDAVDITRRLGFRYLWIDSLCIVQDCEDDWLNESSRMGNYYSSSTLTLAATFAVDGSQGCYSSRRALNESVLLRSTLDDLDFLFTDRKQSFKEGISNAPLNDRGWVVQEKYLSKRTVHFARGQVFWVCNKIAASETFPLGLPGLLNSFSKLEKVHTLEESPHVSWETIAVQWQTLVEQFTKTKLTRSTDRLVAFSGIAKRFQFLFARVANDDNIEYHAGLWAPLCFAHQLLWHVEKQHRTPASSLQPAAYVAPTWSWASNPGAVSWSHDLSYADDIGEPLISVREVSTQPGSHGDRYLTLNGGVLSIRGYLWRLSVDSADGFRFLSAVLLCSWGCKFDHKGQSTLTEVLLLPILGLRYSTSIEIQCLMLQQHKGTSEGTVRVGVCRLTMESTSRSLMGSNSNPEQVLEEFLELLEPDIAVIQPFQDPANSKDQWEKQDWRERARMAHEVRIE